MEVCYEGLKWKFEMEACFGGLLQGLATGTCFGGLLRRGLSMPTYYAGSL